MNCLRKLRSMTNYLITFDIRFQTFKTDSKMSDSLVNNSLKPFNKFMKVKKYITA